jgi:quinol monooxygenase YgiN
MLRAFLRTTRDIHRLVINLPGSSLLERFLIEFLCWMELTIEIRAKREHLQELGQTLQALLPTMRKEKGCRDCRISRDVEDGELFLLSAHWEAQASLEKYMRSGSGMALLGAIDLLSERAAVKIDHDARWERIDTLKRMKKET